MDFSDLKINCIRLPKIFAKHSHGVSEKEETRIKELLLKEQIKGLTEKEYARLEELQEKQKYAQPHIVGAGCQAYLLYIYGLKKYGREPDIITTGVGEPSAANGTLKENYAISLLEEHRGIKIYRSKVRIKNEYLLGVPDAFDDEDWKLSRMVHEIKTTSNRTKFHSKKRYPVSVQQFLQLQGYMALTGKKKAAIHHCLVDYSEIVISEQRKLMFDYFCPDGHETSRFLEAWRIKEGELRFSKMPPENRIFSCFIDRDEKIIEKIYKKVRLCRQWLNDYAEFDKEIESTGTCNIQKNSFLILRRRLGLE